jgi:hypothetical protein
MPSDPDLARLKALLGDLARDEIDSLLTEARDDARREAKAILSKIMLRELLEAAANRPGATRSTPEPSPQAAGDRGDQERPGAPSVSGERAVYVYAITDAGHEEMPASARPMDPRYGIRSVEHGGIKAIVSDVTLGEFGEDALKEGLNDLGWLESKVKSHEHVVDSVRAQGSAVPMRFCTIYRDDAGVRGLLAEHHADLKRALAEVSGRAEYGVKALVDRNAFGEEISASDPEVAVVRNEAAKAEGGKSYFLTKRLNDTVANRTDQRLREICNEAHDRLRDVSLDARVNRPHSKELTGEERDMVMNCSYLIQDVDGERFLDLVRELDRQHSPHGLTFEATGPWPPYSFLTLDHTTEGRNAGTAG